MRTLWIEYLGALNGGGGTNLMKRKHQNNSWSHSSYPTILPSCCVVPSHIMFWRGLNHGTLQTWMYLKDRISWLLWKRDVITLKQDQEREQGPVYTMGRLVEIRPGNVGVYVKRYWSTGNENIGWRRKKKVKRINWKRENNDSQE